MSHLLNSFGLLALKFLLLALKLLREVFLLLPRLQGGLHLLLALLVVLLHLLSLALLLSPDFRKLLPYEVLLFLTLQLVRLHL